MELKKPRYYALVSWAEVHKYQALSRAKNEPMTTTD